MFLPTRLIRDKSEIQIWQDSIFNFFYLYINNLLHGARRQTVANTVGKLIEKVIGERLQFNTVLNNFIHLSQLGGLKFKSTTDAGVALTHTIRAGWVKNLSTSTLAFDIAQFFPSLNH